MSTQPPTEDELRALQGIFTSAIHQLEAAQREVGRLEGERDAAIARAAELEQRVANLQETIARLASRQGVTRDGT